MKNIIKHSDSNINYKYSLIVNNLTLAVGDKTILEDFSTVIKFSKILIIKGRVGSGKSTILKMLGKIIEPTSGNFSILNNENQELESIYLHSQPELNFITGYIRDELLLAGIKDFTDFQDYIDKTVYELNGGALKKLSLLMSLHYGLGRIILADEPLDMLDDIEAEKLTNIIHEYSKKTPFIIATHDSLFDNIADVIVSL